MITIVETHRSSVIAAFFRLNPAGVAICGTLRLYVLSPEDETPGSGESVAPPARLQNNVWPIMAHATRVEVAAALGCQTNIFNISDPGRIYAHIRPNTGRATEMGGKYFKSSEFSNAHSRAASVTLSPGMNVLAFGTMDLCSSRPKPCRGRDPGAFQCRPRLYAENPLRQMQKPPRDLATALKALWALSVQPESFGSNLSATPFMQ